ncbi:MULTISPECIES: adenylate kinase [unclassified Aureispira]|uniref:adenylate kinase n=1 Tax=unclassified Aureispira TaxID=2649989 RepID=UPI0006961D3E|nr:MULTISPECIES: adenylate kinase [unclassified Aureispira]WMX12750.1 adenylate kinase [Aureispira sp. CCB-E]
MLNLILFGPPGSGKGTQAAKLVDKYNLVHISTGDLFRREKKSNSPIWQEVQSYIDKGELAPDSITFRLLKAEMDKTPDAVGYIFDGFPRNVNQAESLDAFLAEEGTEVSLLVELIVADEEVIQRITGRGKIEGRKDDQDPKTVQNRINIYKSQTSPVANHYEKVNKTKRIDGVGTIEEIFERICSVLDAVTV